MALAAVTVSGALAMARARVAVPVPPVLIAPSVTVKLPAWVGVPLIAPVEASSDRPVGRPVAVKLAGELLAATV